MIAGTNYSTGGFRRITRLLPQVKIQLYGFLLVVMGGTFLLSWISSEIWSQLGRLQKEHSAVKGENFYIGVHLRGALRGLNDRLLQFGISQDPTFRDSFLTESAELEDWIATNRTQLADMANLRLLKASEVSKQLDLLEEAQGGYQRYLSNAVLVLSLTNKAGLSNSFETSYKEVRQASSALYPLCDGLVAAQRQGFSEFLHETQQTLIRHQWLLKVCLLMTVALAFALAAVVYRGMIAPLRLGLNESRSIIERQEKLASLGVLASGVAHEVRNPLTAIKFRLFTLRKSIPAVAENADANLIAKEINRLETIVRDFLHFARPSEPRLARIDAHQVLAEVYRLMKGQLERAAIDLRLEPDETVAVHADAEQIKQVLINLIQNSADSIGRNGTITLRLAQDTAELKGRARPVVVFSVADDGKGIPPEIELRLFDPFFTTKPGGTGLGLAISERIVEKHGGLLRYESRMQYGTRFELVLPRIEA